MKASAIRVVHVVHAALSLLLAVAGCGLAWADDAADVRALLQARKLEEARAKAAAFLARHPEDAQMRFMLGLILSGQNKSGEAIAVFGKLAEDHPELPEPHNNLAVLLNASGQYDKARAALEKALRANPDYAIARENLGDVYARLASQAYGKVLERDPGNANVKLKQSLVAKIAGGSASEGTPAASAATASAVKPQPAASAPAAKTTSGNARDELIDTLNSWTSAWSAKDVGRYLSFYGDDFHPQSGMPLSKWKEQRRALIAGKGRIDVRAEEPKVDIDGERATVSFRQVYVSDRVSETSRKTLVMARAGSQWKILEERSK
jgi:tetratricopeptide (TPR) repeat protein